MPAGGALTRFAIYSNQVQTPGWQQDLTGAANTVTWPTPRSLRPSKFQILMVFRLRNQKEDLPPLNKKRIEVYCPVLPTFPQPIKPRPS